MEYEKIFPFDKCKNKGNSTFIISDCFFGGVRIRKENSNYIIDCSSELRIISFFLILLSILVMYFYSGLTSPLFYILMTLAAFVNFLSIIIMEMRVIYVKNRLFKYCGELSDNKKN